MKLCSLKFTNDVFHISVAAAAAGERFVFRWEWGRAHGDLWNVVSPTRLERLDLAMKIFSQIKCRQALELEARWGFNRASSAFMADIKRFCRCCDVNQDESRSSDQLRSNSKNFEKRFSK
jgi:hypothetical protein